MLASPHLGLAPNLVGNPRSATVNMCNMLYTPNPNFRNVALQILDTIDAFLCED